MIREPEVFVERVRIAERSQLPDWQFATRHVGYYDPVGVKPAEIEIAGSLTDIAEILLPQGRQSTAN